MSQEANEDQRRKWKEHYYANISLIDEGIGKIVAALDANGALDRTLMVLTSDHGDALGDHGLSFKSCAQARLTRLTRRLRWLACLVWL